MPTFYVHTQFAARLFVALLLSYKLGNYSNFVWKLKAMFPRVSYDKPSFRFWKCRLLFYASFKCFCFYFGG
jgi:hypothetical protein